MVAWRKKNNGLHPDSPAPQFYDQELEGKAPPDEVQPDPSEPPQPLPAIIPSEPVDSLASRGIPPPPVEPPVLEPASEGSGTRVARPQLAGPTMPVAPSAPTEEPDGFRVRPRTFGDRPTFAKENWWSDRGWWRVAENGEANDIRAHVGTVGRLAVAAASLRGNKHRTKGEGNQDSFAVAVCRDDSGPRFLIAAVCDGLGSSKYSAFGARLVAQATVDRLAELLAGTEDHVGLLARAVPHLLLDVTNQVTNYRLGEFGAPPVSFGDITLGDLQCTLTFMVMPCGQGDGLNGRVAVLGMIGDSPALLLRAGGWERLDLGKDGDGLWDTRTEAVLGADRAQIVEVRVMDGEAVLLTSDGIGNFLTFEGRPTAVGSELASAWTQPVGHLEFVRDIGFELASADDDRTAVMVWVKESKT